EVIIGAESPRSLAGSSRYCRHSFVYPSPYQEPEQFITRLLAAAREFRADALFPVSDIAMHVLGPEKTRFESHLRIPTPAAEVFEGISDKYRLMRQAVEAGVPIPDTIFVPDGRLDGLSERITEFPVVIKPGCSLVKEQGRWTKTAVCYAHSRAELQHLYRTQPHLRRPSLIQRRIIGEGQGLFVLMQEGKPLGIFAHRRVRERPPSGGVSVLRESIALPKDMVEATLKLLQPVKWHGVAMVEFKIEKSSQRPMLMEINGRFWGSLQLAVDAGVNFPLLLLNMAMGKPETIPENGYRIGVKSRWLLGDLDQLLMRLTRRDSSLHLPPGAPSRLQALASFCRFFERDLFYEVEQADDLGPSKFEIMRYVKLA
ncbi:MAG TPA: ATP-grasp domain-containing protein, partial [Nitrospira sp.]|nr:ATP-grasp domain-containing protein [Nitrospira sp.]